MVDVITKRDRSYYEDGENILKKYSYNLNVSTDINPVTKMAVDGARRMFNTIYVILFTYLFTKIFVFHKALRRLREKAELMVEGKEIKLSDGGFKDSIIQNLDSQFSLMKKRIDSSIELLKDEKINLKNIISDILHQLKTPLGALLVYTQILSEHKNMKEGEIDYFLSLTNGQLKRIDFLGKNLLKYARFESNVVRISVKSELGIGTIFTTTFLK